MRKLGAAYEAFQRQFMPTIRVYNLGKEMTAVDRSRQGMNWSDSSGQERQVDTLWTVQDVARFLRCSTRHVCRLRRDLGLPAIRLGPSVRFKPDHVMAWIEECRDQPERSGRGQT